MKFQDWVDVIVGVVMGVGVVAFVLFMLSGCAAQRLERCVASGRTLGACQEREARQREFEAGMWRSIGGGYRERDVVVVPGWQGLGVMPGPMPGTFSTNPPCVGCGRGRYTVVPVR